MKSYLFPLLFTVSSFFLQAQDCLLEKPVVHDIVQDYAEILSEKEEQELRRALIAFDDTTSTQILVVTVKTLCGYDKATFTFELAEKWGVGQKGKDNGIVIMVKPKEIDGKGETFIATGYGLEGVLPDAIGKRIVENEMIPHFKKKDYYGGITAATLTVMAITSGEYAREKNFSNLLPLLFILIFFIFVMVFKASRTRKYADVNDMSFLAAWALMNASNRNHGGFFNNFGSGGGNFGGFGGGSFGGGGAGGSW